MDDEVVMGVDNVPADVGVFGDEPVLRIHCHIVLPVLEWLLFGIGVPELVCKWVIGIKEEHPPDKTSQAHHILPTPDSGRRYHIDSIG